MNPAAINANPLDQLRDIHLPEPISWWPLAPGWWLLIIIALALMVWATRFFTADTKPGSIAARH